MPGTVFPLEITPALPVRIARLAEIANNLWYSWDHAGRSLFSRLHPSLWNAVGHSPRAFLKRIDQKRLDAAAEDPAYIAAYHQVLSAYDNYHDPKASNGDALPGETLIAYFCAEFGFHESLPIYSGGLGILAGDHCKAASDLGLPFVGVGLLYRQGYFTQQIDLEGSQQAIYLDSRFDDLPITPVTDGRGDALRIAVDFPGRTVYARIWQVRAGNIRLYLLDAYLPENSPRDRDITHQLYGGDRTTRIEQEILLGIGGRRALAALGLQPTVWHINEGHAAFLILERIRMMLGRGLDLASALEAVAVNTVFTTHTPVPAGHDHFSREQMQAYFGPQYAETGFDFEQLMALGRTADSPDFNMTTLAIRGSRHQNGVSRIHGGVSADICAGLWPQIEPHENPMAYITNGVHVGTFLRGEWQELLNRYFPPGWKSRMGENSLLTDLARVPDHLYWSVHQSIKSDLLQLVRHLLRQQLARNQQSESHIERLLEQVDPDNPNILTIGFARRFATYKRATLLFSDLDWLRRLLADAGRPVLFLFAGKAHPADEPGQALIRRINEISQMPDFIGRVLFIEGYDMRLARRLVAGVDVWLNNPIYPLEASGTSGMKAGMNGVPNLSVLDGWWGEGYDGGNGWAIKPASGQLPEARRDAEEARALYELLQDQVLPCYYARGSMGYSPAWVAMSKRSMASIMPQFNASRMVRQYLHKFYLPATDQWAIFRSGDFAAARQLADWKQRVREAWPGLTAQRADPETGSLKFGDRLQIAVDVVMNGLSQDDLRVEMLLSRPSDAHKAKPPRVLALSPAPAPQANGVLRYHLDFIPEMCGNVVYQLRIVPTHPHLTHPHETGLMTWL
jgi:starch phosphorylase